MNTKLKKILDKIQSILKYLEKEKMDGFRDPKIVLASHLHSLAGDITTWLNVFTSKSDKNLVACLYLAPAPYIN